MKRARKWGFSRGALSKARKFRALLSRGFAVRRTGVHRCIISERPDILFIEPAPRWGGPGPWRTAISNVRAPLPLFVSWRHAALRYAIPVHERAGRTKIRASLVVCTNRFLNGGTFLRCDQRIYAVRDGSPLSTKSSYESWITLKNSVLWNGIT